MLLKTASAGERKKKTQSQLITKRSKKSLKDGQSSPATVTHNISNSDDENTTTLKVKMLIMGSTMKTNLVSNLKHEAADLSTKKKRIPREFQIIPINRKKRKITENEEHVLSETEVLSVHNMQIYSKELDAEIKFEILDFSDSENNKSIVSMYISDKTINLVVWNLSQKLTYDSINYWIKILRSYSPKTIIILVGVYNDEKPAHIKSQIDNAKSIFLNGDYPNVKAVLSTSLDTGKGVLDLLKNMEELVSPQIFCKEDRTTECIKTKLKALTSNGPPLVSWEEFEALAKESMIVKNDNPSELTQEIIKLADILHYQGNIYTIPVPEGKKNLKLSVKDVIFTDIHWLSLLVTSITKAKHGANIKKGKIFLDDLFKKIWNNPMVTVPSMYQQLLVNYLDQSEVVCILPLISETDREEVLIPSLLPLEKPNLEALWPQTFSETTSGTKQLNRNYKFNVCPIGLASRIISHLMYIGTLHSCWQSGILLSEPNGESRALIEVCEPYELTVYVRGKKIDIFFCLVTEIVESIIKIWFAAKPQISTVCLSCEEIATQKEDMGVFSKKELIKCLMTGQRTRCPKCNQAYQVSEVAPDISLYVAKAPKLDEKEVILDKEIGRGAFAVVYCGTLYNQTVAIKQLFYHEDELEDSFDEFLQEVSLLDTVKHPNIVGLKGFSFSKFTIVMEYIPENTLYNWLQSHPTINWSLRLRIAVDISNALCYLHSFEPPIIHRDLKSPNILLKEINHEAQVVAKLADFGTAGKISLTTRGQTAKERKVENPTWLGPEIIKGHKYQTSSDIYPYGVILWEIYTTKHPFDEFEFRFNSDLEEAVTNGIRPTIPIDCPYTFKDLIMKCWHQDINSRPNFREVNEIILPDLIKQFAPGLKLTQCKNTPTIEENDTLTIIRKKKEITQRK